MLNLSKKIKSLELLNFEGAVLKAYRANDTFVIVDQWGVMVDILIGPEMSDFINGLFLIKDSRGKSWFYPDEPAGAKKSINQVNEFISI